MKVFLIAQSYLPRIGGRELYQDKILAHFAPDEVVVLTPDREGDYAAFDADYRFKVLRCSPMANNWFYQGRRAQARWFADLAWLCLRERPDVILCETVLPDGLSGWLLNQTLGKPYVVFVTGTELADAMATDYTRARLSKVMVSASKIIAISNFLGRLVIEQGAHSDKVAVVVPGVDPLFVAPDDGCAQLVRERYGLQGKKVIISISRLVARKGFDKVIEAMPAVLNAVPNAVYLVVGDGPDRARLEIWARTLGVEQQVVFVGPVPNDEVSPFYSAADVFAMPNREMPGDYEGFGIVFLEANARGLPVIGGRSAGALDAVADGESGYLVNPVDAAEIARRLIEVLRDPELARRLGKNGRLRVEAHFSWDRAAKQVQSLILGAAPHSPTAIPKQVQQTLSTLVRRKQRLFADDNRHTETLPFIKGEFTRQV